MQELILQLGKKYANLVVLTADSQWAEFGKFFPNRYFTFGNGYSNMVSAAAGFALLGKLPIIVGDNVVERCHAQVLNDICKPNLNVKIADRKGAGLILGLPDFEDVAQAVEEYGPMVLKFS